MRVWGPQRGIASSGQHQRPSSLHYTDCFLWGTKLGWEGASMVWITLLKFVACIVSEGLPGPGVKWVRPQGEACTLRGNRVLPMNWSRSGFRGYSGRNWTPGSTQCRMQVCAWSFHPLCISGKGGAHSSPERMLLCRLMFCDFFSRFNFSVKPEPSSARLAVLYL